MTPAALLFWVLSAVGGAVLASGLLSLGTYGLITLIVLLLVAIRLSKRTTAVGGFVFGFGAAATFAFIASYARCAGEGQAVCVAQNVLPALVLALLALFAGISLTWSPRRSRHSSR